MTEPKPPELTPTQPEGPRPLSRRNQILKKKLDELIKKLPEDKAGELFGKITERADYLRNKYPDWKKREVIHLLSSSGQGMNETEVNEDDYEGEDSVASFVFSMVAEYGPHSV